MITVVIDQQNEGGRLDKFLRRLLKEAGSGFIYKMLRKKNITLNGARAQGNELLRSGDEVRFFFAEETYEKFTGARASQSEDNQAAAQEISGTEYGELSIVYEDKNILLIDKPAGLLSQRDASGAVSANDLCLSYLTETGGFQEETSYGFTPSICNRLDRNTSGLLIFAKNYTAARELSSAFRERTIKKFYEALVGGEFSGEGRQKAYLKKDPATNTVRIFSEKTEGAALIETDYRLKRRVKDFSLLSVELLTGKTHQIRAQLSAMGCPILGDPKYGKPSINRKLLEEYGVNRQLLHAREIVMPEFPGCLKEISGRTFQAERPADFIRVLEK